MNSDSFALILRKIERDMAEVGNDYFVRVCTIDGGEFLGDVVQIIDDADVLVFEAVGHNRGRTYIALQHVTSVAGTTDLE